MKATGTLQDRSGGMVDSTKELLDLLDAIRDGERFKAADAATNLAWAINRGGVMPTISPVTS